MWSVTSSFVPCTFGNSVNWAYKHLQGSWPHITPESPFQWKRVVGFGAALLPLSRCVQAHSKNVWKGLQRPSFPPHLQPYLRRSASEVFPSEHSYHSGLGHFSPIFPLVLILALPLHFPILFFLQVISTQPQNLRQSTLFPFPRSPSWNVSCWLLGSPQRY